MRAGADQADALRRDEPGGARQRRDAHDGKAGHHESGEGGEIEQHDPAARIVDTDLRQEAEHQKADQRDVPQLDGAARMRLEREEIRHPVFAAKHVGDGEYARRQEPDLDAARNLVDVAVGDAVIDHAGGARRRHDQGDVDEKDRHGKGAARQRRPGAQQPARRRLRHQRVIGLNVHQRGRLRCYVLGERVPPPPRNGTARKLKPMARQNRASDAAMRG